MTWANFLKDYAANILTVVTLLLLAYQIWSSNQQFRILNKGYIDVVPVLGPIRPDFGQAGIPEDYAPTMPVAGFKCEFNLTNVGNLPIWYQATKYTVFFKESPLIPVELKKFRPAVIYPKQTINFRIPMLKITDAGTSLLFSAVDKAPFRIVLRIEYCGGRGDKVCAFDRDIHLSLNGPKFDYRWLEIRDSW